VSIVEKIIKHIFLQGVNIIIAVESVRIKEKVANKNSIASNVVKKYIGNLMERKLNKIIFVPLNVLMSGKEEIS
jgi:hypothetical protein